MSDPGRCGGRVLAPMAWWGFLAGINGAAAPSLAVSFGLDDREIAWALGWVGLASVGAWALGRQADRLGRRRLLLACLAGLPGAALASALAPGVAAYVAAQLAAYALGWTLLAVLMVVIAEQDAQRARGQGRAGTVFTVATALPLLLAGALGERPDAWRWLWALGAAPALAWPLFRRALPETRRWRDAEARGETARVRMRDVFAPRYRRRALAVLAAVGLLNGMEIVCRLWLFYHPVRTLGLAPSTAVMILLAGGAASLAGFPLGAALADRVGRRATFVAASAVFGVGAVGYYGLSVLEPVARPLELAFFFGLLAFGGNAGMVAFRTTATELFPTRLRGCLGGWMAVASALGWWLEVSAAGLLSGLTGALGPAVALLVLLVLPTLWALQSLLPETAGLRLEQAALEDEAESLSEEPA